MLLMNRYQRERGLYTSFNLQMRLLTNIARWDSQSARVFTQSARAFTLATMDRDRRVSCESLVAYLSVRMLPQATTDRDRRVSCESLLWLTCQSECSHRPQWTEMWECLVMPSAVPPDLAPDNPCWRHGHSDITIQLVDILCVNQTHIMCTFMHGHSHACTRIYT